MSGLCVEVVSRETIKPSSPTPSHLNTVKLSLIDQIIHQLFVPVLLFFSSSAVPNSVRVDCLKKSLSKTLNLFYPFAGRIIDNRFIRCNDDGISWFEARVNAQMARVVSHPTREELVQLIPHDVSLSPVPKELLSVQINIFDCGGMALCVCLSHKVADASSLGFFLNTWAATARGDPADKIPCPVFAGPHFFPPIETELLPPVPDPVGTQPEIVTKRFIFNAPNISTLRDKLLYRPSRVETVSAFLWRCFMNVAGWRSSTLYQVMNLRARMDPPLASSMVGNFMSGVKATSSTTPTPPELECLVGELHRAISKVDGNYVRKLQDINEILKIIDCFNEPNQSFLGITSWCRFPFYEADFGWGKPEWVTALEALESPDLVILMDTKCGTGIEAWVTLDKQVMGRFESDPLLIASTT